MGELGWLGGGEGVGGRVSGIRNWSWNSKLVSAAEFETIPEMESETGSSGIRNWLSWNSKLALVCFETRVLLASWQSR